MTGISVITSYSIHYTKLYDVARQRVRAQRVHQEHQHVRARPVAGGRVHGGPVVARGPERVDGAADGFGDDVVDDSELLQIGRRQLEGGRGLGRLVTALPQDRGAALRGSYNFV